MREVWKIEFSNKELTSTYFVSPNFQTILKAKYFWIKTYLSKICFFDITDNSYGFNHPIRISSHSIELFLNAILTRSLGPFPAWKSLVKLIIYFFPDTFYSKRQSPVISYSSSEQSSSLRGTYNGCYFCVGWTNHHLSSLITI